MRRTFNFRVLAFPTDIPNLPEKLAERYKDYYDLRICEVHYNNDIPHAYAEAQTVNGETVKGIRWRLNKMKIALSKPILYAGDRFPEEFKI